MNSIISSSLYQYQNLIRSIDHGETISSLEEIWDSMPKTFRPWQKEELDKIVYFLNNSGDDSRYRTAWSGAYGVGKSWFTGVAIATVIAWAILKYIREEQEKEYHGIVQRGAFALPDHVSLSQVEEAARDKKSLKIESPVYGAVFAGTFAQANCTVWRELQSIINTSKFRHLMRWTNRAIVGRGRLQDVSLLICKAFNDDSEKTGQHVHGIHSKTVIVAIDEAIGVPDSLFERVRSYMSSARGVQIVSSNPSNGQSAFRDIFETVHTGPEQWNTRYIARSDALEPGQTEDQMANEYIAKYGEESDIVQMAVYGRFGKMGGGFFTQAELAVAQMEHPYAPEYDSMTDLVIGLDVSAGQNDDSVFCMRSDYSVPEAIVYEHTPLDQLKYRTIEILNEYKPRFFVVDAVGVGLGFLQMIKHEINQNCPYTEVIGNRQTSPKEYVYAADFTTEMAYRAKAWLAGGGTLPRNEDCKAAQRLVKELLYYKLDTEHSRNLHTVRLLPKRISHKGVSPDVADAFFMTFAFPSWRHIQRRKAINIVDTSRKRPARRF